VPILHGCTDLVVIVVLQGGVAPHRGHKAKR